MWGYPGKFYYYESKIIITFMYICFNNGFF